MQRPGRAALPPSSSTYTDQQVLDQILRGTSVTETFTFELLDADGSVKDDITGECVVTNSNISWDTTRDVQTTMTINVKGNPLDQMNDLIRPHYQMKMPDGGWVDFVLGLFNVLPDADTITRSYSINALNCADSSQLLSDSGIKYAAGFAAGSNVVQAITSVVETYGGNTPIPVVIPDTGKRLPAAISWNAGTSRTAIVNALLSAMNYYPFWCDYRGRLRSDPIPDYSTVEEAVSLDTQTDAIVAGSMSTTADPSQWFNQFLLTVSNPATSVANGTAASNGTSSTTGQGFSAYYENNDPASPISLANWHPKLKSWSDSSIVDKATAYAACKTAAQVSARVYAPVSLNTATWPLSQSNDIIRLHIVAEDEPETDYLYIETAWQMTLQPGGTTSHVLERIS